MPVGGGAARYDAVACGLAAPSLPLRNCLAITERPVVIGVLDEFTIASLAATPQRSTKYLQSS